MVPFLALFPALNVVLSTSVPPCFDFFLTCLARWYLAVVYLWYDFVVVDGGVVVVTCVTGGGRSVLVAGFSSFVNLSLGCALRVASFETALAWLSSS
uniref:Putative secreted protein n=1 Tax=Ixodes ricinus TaxID=34613 RepID=A0A6B0UDN0_IXORI